MLTSLPEDVDNLLDATSVMFQGGSNSHSIARLNNYTIPGALGPHPDKNMNA